MTAYARAPESVTAEAAHRLAAYLQQGEVVTATDDGRLVLRLRHADRGARPVRLQEMAYHAIEVFDRLGFHAGVVDLGVGWAPITRKQGPDDARAQAARAADESVAQRDLQPRQRGAHVRDRQPRVGCWSASHQFVAATVGSVLLPFLALVTAYRFGARRLRRPLLGPGRGAARHRHHHLGRECARPRPATRPRRADPAPRRERAP